MITIVDYGAGNIASIQNMFKRIGVTAIIAGDEATIANAEKLVLPGVGAFDTCASKMQQSGLRRVLNQKVLELHTPVLGICAGMQLMTEESEEGILPGLGWMPGKTIKFDTDKLLPGYKIPHMGWAGIERRKISRLLTGMDEAPRFYFVHSYYVLPADTEDVVASASNGCEFAAVLERDNITAVQFHPEKSHRFGMQLLANFVRYY